MESLPLQNLFQSKIHTPGEEMPPEKSKLRLIANSNVIAPAADLCYYGRSRDAVSACCKDKAECVTTAAKPLLIAFQLLSIFPVTFRKKNCRFFHCWLSFPSMLNLGVTVATICASVTIMVVVQDIIGRFKGTDFYTISLISITQFGATILVFAVGNISAPTFCRGWQALHDVADELELTSYRTIKLYLLFIPATLIAEGTINTLTINAHMVDDDFRKLMNPFVALVTTVITNFFPNFLTFSFAVILWVCAYLFENLNQSISACLEQPSRDFLTVTTGIGIFPQDHGIKLARLRRTHENLCDAVRLLEKAFGFQLLVIFPATGLRFVGGIYTVLVDIMGLSPANMEGLVVAEGIASILAGCRIMLVILSADFVMTKASGSVQALKHARSPYTSDEVNQEIDVFLSKVGMFPLEIKCCSIITLNLSFLSTAIPNVITYVLVLMQFKQGDENGSVHNCLVDNATTNHGLLD